MSAWEFISSNDQVHAIACFYAASEAIMQGHRTDVVPRERQYQLRVGDAMVQVSAQRKGAWISDVDRPLADNTAAVVFVDLSGDTPDFYVVPREWLIADVTRHHEAFMRRVGGRRPRKPGSTHHTIDVERLTQWHRRWDVLRTPGRGRAGEQTADHAGT